MSAHNINALWLTYCAARERAESSRSLADGIAAGRAWGAFLRAFEGHKPQQTSLHVVDGGRA